MTSELQPRILLVEDDPALGPLIVELLSEDYRVELARDGQQGLHRGLSGSWDAIIVDRGLPVIDGIALIAALRAKSVATPILILTALGSVQDKVAGLDAGANDYMTKPFDVVELSARLRALTRTYSAPQRIITLGDWQLDLEARLLRSVHGRLVGLTLKELELLSAFGQEPERVFSREELLAALFQASDQPGVIDTYVHHLRRKISRQIIRTVHGVGYQLGETDD
ncbi:response regulator transcription factor [Psychromicrobium lacuslunae]|uniref:Transcriptional regulator n=1 Tax=Psychromicrobium lacuslunae TaxID=1618207 RepID=A0A0D4C0B5_9MICC|nr:response regulator transcription factor [Psychromicrobium lacuslunae]AJT41860.1 hypothetical protein UM93_10650 [Psychromicrobium lacuslunae]